MITLITGVPGSGKSAALVELLSALAKGRVIYANGIPDLLVPHQALDDATKWHEVVPDGSAIAIDEVQRVWRARGPGQKVPADVAALETHRHRGLDFFIVTQGPNLLDRNVRALVGRHIHLRDNGILGRHWYEWPECSENLAWKTAPIRKRYRLPKKVFSLYKSASLHTKPIRSFPMALIAAGVACMGVLYFGYRSYDLVRSKFTGAPPPVVGGAASAPVSPSASAPRVVLRNKYTRDDIERAARPVVPNRPETAPMYDHLRVVVRMPRIMGGYCQSTGCVCYVQNGQRAPIDHNACFQWVQNPPFDPYFVPDTPGRSGFEPDRAASASQSASL